MDPIVGILAENLQTYRQERNMTLQELAAITGVSRSMLSGIEKGSTAPTITVLAKIAAGLRITIPELLRENVPDCKLVKREDFRVLHGDKEHTADQIFAYNGTRHLEICHLTFQPGGSYKSITHRKSAEEYTMVYEGELTIEVAGTPNILRTGDALTFNGASIHTYHNHTGQVSKAYTVIYYPEKNSGQ